MERRLGLIDPSRRAHYESYAQDIKTVVFGN